MYLAQRRDSIIGSHDYLMQSLNSPVSQARELQRRNWSGPIMVVMEPQMESKGCVLSPVLSIHFVLWTLKLLIFIVLLPFFVMDPKWN